MAFTENSGLPLTHHHIATAHGTLHLSSLAPTPTASNIPANPPNTSPTPTLLLIHGNSSCSLSFHRLLTHLRAHSSPLTTHRTLLLDLPGHGASTDAPHPEASYTQPAYAAAALDVLEALGCLSGGVVVLGWSLGGHVALEMAAADEARMRRGGADATRCVQGVMIVGTPPALGEAQVAAGFLHDPPPPPASETNDDGEEKEEGEEEGDRMLLAEQETWPATAFSTFPYAAIGEPHDDWIRSAAQRTDGRARRIMFDAFKGGRGVDQRQLCEESDVPVAVVNGGAEPFVNLDYLDEIAYANLWEGAAHRIDGLGHAPFWERPDLFASFWERFVGDCLK
ncbi:Alpha/Beta hydrolase protein [Phyllosticta citribraziliensis]|uniref:Alpha/Beta hydrolase protein n=1 Tax=Phyllosticta citribraziliensis TaxID=989973 RepID=A0ABR1LAU1_9PEZI